MDFIYQFQAKLKLLKVANLEGINISNNCYEELIKGVLKYQLIPDLQLVKYLSKNNLSINQDNLSLVTNLDELLKLISQKVNTILKNAEKHAEKEAYDKAIQEIIKTVS